MQYGPLTANEVNGMLEIRETREKELIAIATADCIRLIRIYQGAIGTPHGQIAIPGIPQRRMIDVILKKEFPLPP